MEKYLPWLALKSVPGIGNLLIRRLIEHFDSPQRIFQASCAELAQVNGISDRLANALKKYRIPDKLKRELDLAERKGYSIVTFVDPDYPPLLREVPDPPPFLYVNGHLNPRSNKVAVVGSRHATNYGMTTTKRLCRDLAALQLTVVSGLAKGIDTAAHEGALSGKGETIAVLGSGLAKIYPGENRRLANRIALQGAVVSEFSLTAGPEAHHFPARNRIISGMSLGVVVAEATRKSGSLITARLAADQGREVFAVPGSVHSFKSTGTHGLIKQGAKLVEHAQDVIEELAPQIDTRVTSDLPYPGRPTGPTARLSDDEAKIFHALEPYPVHIDDLTRKVLMGTGKALSVLLHLELKGLVRQSPGSMFAREERQ